MSRSFASASGFALSLGLAAAGWSGHARAQAPADLSAGGLAPPPAVESQSETETAAAAPNQTEAELAEADRKDSGRGLEFVWLNGEIGVGHFGLNTFKKDDLFGPGPETTQTGLVVGAGAGLRLVFWTLGARFRYGAFSDWKLWTLGVEGGLHMPLGAFEPYATLGVGYASVSSSVVEMVDLDGSSSSGSTSAKGLDARLGLGADYYLTNMFSVGLNVTGDMLVLSRSAVDGAAAGSTFASDASSIGAGVTATFVGGLHF
jgi:opacity protein-like surface antigen